MAGDLLLIVAPDTDGGDRLAQALSQNGQYAFVFAHDPDGAVAVASSLEPDLIVMVLPGEEGIRACEQLRNIPETRAIRVLLVIDRAHLSASRSVGVSGILFQPASALLVAFEAKRVLERVERRMLWVRDRRDVFRGGRRMTDIASG